MLHDDLTIEQIKNVPLILRRLGQGDAPQKLSYTINYLTVAHKISGCKLNHNDIH